MGAKATAAQIASSSEDITADRRRAIAILLPDARRRRPISRRRPGTSPPLVAARKSRGGALPRGDAGCQTLPDRSDAPVPAQAPHPRWSDLEAVPQAFRDRFRVKRAALGAAAGFFD